MNSSHYLYIYFTCISHVPLHYVYIMLYFQLLLESGMFWTRMVNI